MICASGFSQLHKNNKGNYDFTTKEFLQFVRYTSFEVLGPEFHVSGDNVTYTYSELSAIYQEMQNRGEAYLHYLEKQHQEVPTNGSS